MKSRGEIAGDRFPGESFVAPAGIVCQGRAWIEGDEQNQQKNADDHSDAKHQPGFFRSQNGVGHRDDPSGDEADHRRSSRDGNRQPAQQQRPIPPANTSPRFAMEDRLVPRQRGHDAADERHIGHDLIAIAIKLVADSQSQADHHRGPPIKGEKNQSVRERDGRQAEKKDHNVGEDQCVIAEYFEEAGQHVRQARVGVAGPQAVIKITIPPGQTPRHREIHRAVGFHLPAAVESQEIRQEQQAKQRFTPSIAPIENCLGPAYRRGDFPGDESSSD